LLSINDSVRQPSPIQLRSTERKVRNVDFGYGVDPIFETTS
jgi:hypothetical protein